MKLPHPRESLAGCCWLPRFVAKIRIYLRGDLPLVYRAAFGSSVGIDGYFLRHFGLKLPQVIAAVRASSNDAAVAKWFMAQPGVTTESIATWNDFAPRIGSKHHPGYALLQTVRWIFYPKSNFRRLGSLFEAIEQDEELAPHR